MRLVLAVIAGAAVAAFGGLILGEYQMAGYTPYVAGPLFGLSVAEVILAVGRKPGMATALAAAVCTVAGLGWAVWIFSGEGLAPIPAGAWVALGLGAAAGLLRGGVRAVLAPGANSRPSA